MESPEILYIGDIYKGLKEVINNYNTEKYKVKYFDELDEKEKLLALNTTKYLLTGNVSINYEILSEVKNTKLIQNTGVGNNNIDLDYASERGIYVANAPGSNSIAVSELTIGCILSLYRKLIHHNNSIRNGNWEMWNLRSQSFEMSGKIHGIIGFGNVGKTVAERSIAFGTKIYYYDVIKASKETEIKLNAEYLPLEELLKISDIVSVHIPLISSTKNLIKEKEFNLMKKNSIIINVSRGGIVNEKDLYKALKSKKMMGAALDVWEEEPVDKHNKLLSLNEVLATPHIGAGTLDTMKRVYEICFDNIIKFENEEVINNIVNKNEVTHI